MTKEELPEYIIDVVFRYTGCGIKTLAAINREVRALLATPSPKTGGAPTTTLCLDPCGVCEACAGAGGIPAERLTHPGPAVPAAEPAYVQPTAMPPGYVGSGGAATLVPVSAAKPACPHCNSVGAWSCGMDCVYDLARTPAAEPGKPPGGGASFYCRCGPTDECINCKRPYLTHDNFTSRCQPGIPLTAAAGAAEPGKPATCACGRVGGGSTAITGWVCPACKARGWKPGAPAAEPGKPMEWTVCPTCGGPDLRVVAAVQGLTCGALANDGTACTRLPHPESPDYHTDGTEYCWIGGTGRTSAAGTAPTCPSCGNDYCRCP